MLAPKVQPLRHVTLVLNGTRCNLVPTTNLDTLNSVNILQNDKMDDWKLETEENGSFHLPHTYVLFQKTWHPATLYQLQVATRYFRAGRHAKPAGFSFFFHAKCSTSKVNRLFVLMPPFLSVRNNQLTATRDSQRCTISFWLNLHPYWEDWAPIHGLKHPIAGWNIQCCKVVAVGESKIAWPPNNQCQTPSNPYQIILKGLRSQRCAAFCLIEYSTIPNHPQPSPTALPGQAVRFLQVMRSEGFRPDDATPLGCIEAGWLDIDIVSEVAGCKSVEWNTHNLNPKWNVINENDRIVVLGHWSHLQFLLMPWSRFQQLESYAAPTLGSPQLGSSSSSSTQVFVIGRRISSIVPCKIEVNRHGGITSHNLHTRCQL